MFGFKKKRNNALSIAYVCDKNQCEKCGPECQHTLDVKHAANFMEAGPGKYIELVSPASNKILDALDVAFQYGQTREAHHATWVIDQMVRALVGDKEAYKKWVAEYEDGGEYEWNVGIAP